MIQSLKNHFRVLAIAPSTRGFGFAVMEGEKKLVDWGVKSVKGNKNAQCLAKMEELIAHYEPAMISLQDHSGRDSRRSTRIRVLGRQIITLASRRRVKVKFVSNKRLR